MTNRKTEKKIIIAIPKGRILKELTPILNKVDIIVLILLGYVLAMFLFAIKYEVISIIFSTSIKPFSFKVFPVETKSTILLLKSSLGAISNAPFNFKHSA